MNFSVEDVILESDDQSEEQRGSDDDEFDDLYYNQKVLAKQLEKIRLLPSKLTYLV